jgi:hypothetical protein
VLAIVALELSHRRQGYEQCRAHERLEEDVLNLKAFKRPTSTGASTSDLKLLEIEAGLGIAETVKFRSHTIHDRQEEATYLAVLVACFGQVDCAARL